MYLKRCPDALNVLCLRCTGGVYFNVMYSTSLIVCCYGYYASRILIFINGVLTIEVLVLTQMIRHMEAASCVDVAGAESALDRLESETSAGHREGIALLPPSSKIRATTLSEQLCSRERLLSSVP